MYSHHKRIIAFMANLLKQPETPPHNAPLRDVLAYWIRLYRVGKSWSQEQLAFECNLDRTYISAVERSRWNVSLGNIEKIAIALEVAPWKLLVPPKQTKADT